MKVALFGGSFNPIHNGHLEIADELIKKKIVDEVWFIPCGNHAFGKELASGGDRIRMINLAIGDNPNLKVINTEIKSSEKSFTANTIRLLEKEFPHDFYFVLGMDNLNDLDKWYDFDYLKENVKFILVKRGGFRFSNKNRIKIIEILQVENNISSTQIRGNIKKKVSIIDLVPENVAEYITRGIYYEKAI